MDNVEPTTGQSKLLLWVGVGTLLLGLAMLAFGVTFVAEAGASQDWPATIGLVSNVRITWDTIRGAQEAIPEWGCHLQVYYDYAVEGESYSGSLYVHGDGSTASPRRYRSEEEAREAAFAAYTPAQEIKVHYDPADPGSAVLNPGVSAATYVSLMLGAPFALSGVGLFLLYFRQRT